MKVLIISHNPITTHGNMGKTMLTLFSAFGREELAQLYIYPTIPDIAVCNAYFRVTDKDVLKSYCALSVKGREIGTEEIRPEETAFEDERDEGLYRNKKNKTPLRMLLRDAMWRYARWNNRALHDFIEKERPDVVFVATGPAKFLYRMVTKVTKRYSLPYVTYICDDYYFMKPQVGFLGGRQHHTLKKEIGRHVRAAETAITISEPIAELYRKEFGTRTEVVMTGAGFPLAKEPKDGPAPQSITYLGGIRCNRYRSLAEIGRALDALNEKNGTAFTLNIYTEETEEAFLAELRDIRSIRLPGYVTGEEFRRVFDGADLLLHTEAFDEASIDLVKHSVSTKIADSLASGIPLLAYGPSSIISVQYLLENDAALVATDKDGLEDWLLRAFYDGDARRCTVENALALSRKRHDPNENSRTVHRLLEEAAKKS